MKVGKSFLGNRKKNKIEFYNFIPDLIIIAQSTMNFEKANCIAKKNGIELRFKCREDFEDFLIQVNRVRMYENKRKAL